jgi:peroxiredoxin
LVLGYTAGYGEVRAPPLHHRPPIEERSMPLASKHNRASHPHRARTTVGRRAASAAVATFLATTLSAVAPALAEVKIGGPAPAFTGTDSKGATHALSALKGKTVVLEWTNDGCPYVAKHYGSGNMQALQREAKAKGVVWLSVVSSAPGKQGHVVGLEADKLTAERKAEPAAVLLDPDGKIGRAYGARTTPHMYVVAPDGTLAYMGAIDDKPTANPADVPTARNYVREALAAVTAGKPVAVAATRAYGCSVKY